MILADKILKYGFTALPDDDSLDKALAHPDDRREARRIMRFAQQETIHALKQTNPKTITERFVFEDDMAAALIAFDERVKGDKRWRNSLQIPADAFWVEWKLSPKTMELADPGAETLKIQTGMLMHWTTVSVPGRVRDTYETLHCWLIHHITCIEDPFRPDRPPLIRSHLVMTDCPDSPPKERVRMHWCKTPDWKGNGWMTIDMLSYCIFLLTQPRTYELRHVMHSPKLVAARLKDRKQPPLEYKAIKFHPGAVQVRYEKHPSDPNLPHDTRRLHSVIGHWRHHDDGSLSWIRYHWRGDRNKGQVIHERHVDP